jgi:diacylglycerol kinase
MEEKNQEQKFRQPLYKTFGNAFNGLSLFFRKERNGKIQVAVTVIILITGFVFHLSAIEWILILICICLVLALEMINSAVEHLCNLVHNEYHPSIKIIKDIAAGAVLFASIISVIIGLIIIFPKIYMLIWNR